MSKRLKRRIKSSPLARNQDKLVKTFIKVIALIVIAVVLLFITWRLFFPATKTPLIPTHPQVEVKDTEATAAQENRPAKPEFSFYNELKKRSDEVNAEVAAKISEQKQPEVSGRNYRVQIGAFSQENKAEQLRARMILRDYPVQIVKNNDIYMVQIGPYKDRDEAKAIEKKLNRDGLKTIFKAFIN